MGVGIVQLKVCHRKCLSETVGSEYVCVYSFDQPFYKNFPSSRRVPGGLASLT